MGCCYGPLYGGAPIMQPLRSIGGYSKVSLSRCTELMPQASVVVRGS